MIRLGRMFAVVNPAVWLILGLCMAGILWIGGMLTGRGSMEVRQIMAVAEYTTMALGFLITAAGAVLYLPRLRSCMERLGEVLDTIPDIADSQKSGYEPVAGEPVISFENVSFYYPGAEEPVLQNLNFCCNPGETTAISGGTGSGKSTVADLLLRLHDVTDGTIRLHGEDIRHMGQKDLRGVIGCVPQKAFLFSGTIVENLRMGKENASDEELWEALRIAQVRRLLKRLGRQSKRLLGVAVLTFLSSVVFASMPLVVGMAVDRLVDVLKSGAAPSAFPSMVAGALKVPVLLLIAVAVVSGSLSYIQQYLLASVGETLALSLRREISAKLNRAYGLLTSLVSWQLQ